VACRLGKANIESDDILGGETPHTDTSRRGTTSVRGLKCPSTGPSARVHCERVTVHPTMTATRPEESRHAPRRRTCRREDARSRRARPWAAPARARGRRRRSRPAPHAVGRTGGASCGSEACGPRAAARDTREVPCCNGPVEPTDTSERRRCAARRRAGTPQGSIRPRSLGLPVSASCQEPIEIRREDLRLWARRLQRCVHHVASARAGARPSTLQVVRRSRGRRRSS